MFFSYVFILSKYLNWEKNRITIRHLIEFNRILNGLFIELYPSACCAVEIAFLILNLIAAFWNCCLALFKSSLRSSEQSRYLGTRKIHGAKSGSHDRRFTDFGAAACPCRPIEVIAVHVVNSSPNHPDYSLFLFLTPSSSFSLALSPDSHSSSGIWRVDILRENP